MRVSKDLLVDDGEIESLGPTYGDMPKMSLVPLVEQ